MIFQTAKQALWRSCCFGVAVACPFSGALAAPTPEPPLDSSFPNASQLGITRPSAIGPSGSLGYNSDDIGSAPFTHLDGFFPLWQTPGEDLSYLQSRLLVDNNGNLGGSLLLGYRRVSKSGHWVRGAYLGFDQRSTDHNTFRQLGFGLEQLGDVDLRFNAYLPIGTVRQASVNTGLQLRDLYFSGHQLNLVLEQQQIYEAAAKGFDVEVGTQLARLGNGAVKGYAGVYYYEPPRENGVFGYRLRLTANPQSNLNVGLNVQTDPLFGTQVSFQMGTRWGGHTSAPATAEEAPIWTRLGESVERTGTIAIDTQVETAFSGTVVATNPATGDAWHFLHVNPGTSGDGQFATPYATVEAALVAANGFSATENLNTTVYVQDTASPLISTAIPDNVRLWSTGPLQQLNTNEFGTVVLPLSNSGIYPLLTNTVKMQTGTHLAGFTINPATAEDDGVLARDAADLIIRDNRINTHGATAHGVSLINGTGSAQVFDNTITTQDETSHGVQVVQVNGAVLAEATLTGNTITTQGYRAKSIDVFTTNAGSSVTELTVRDNQLSTAGEEASGFSAFARADSTIGTITSHRNTITTTGVQAQAIAIQVRDGASIDAANLTENQITTQGNRGNGVMAFASGNATAGQGHLAQVAIAGNTITTQGNEASAVLAFSSNGGRVTEASLTQNMITTEGADSAGLLAFAAGCDAANPPCDGSQTASQLDDATITGNIVTTRQARADGILAFAVKTGELGTATITGNTVTTYGDGGSSNTVAYNGNNVNTGYSGGIMAFASDASRLDTATVSGNTITTQGTDSNGLAIFAVSDGVYGGSRVDGATVTNNRVTTTGASSAALMAFATNASTLTQATLSGNQLQTSGTQSYGISTFASNSQNFGTAQVTGNQVTTGGSQAHGINLSANNGSAIAMGLISGNTSTTQGSNAYGISVQANAGANGGSTLNQVTVTQNQAQTTNTYADALAVILQGNGSTFNQGTITSNTFQTQGTGAQGLSALVSAQAEVSQLALGSNQITTRGGCTVVGGNVTCADGINFLNLNSTVSGTTQITDNRVATSGIGAAGIVGSAIGTAQTANLIVTGNTITTAGARYNSTSALGINLSAIAGATLTAATITRNTVTTQGERAHGLQLLATGGTITTASVAQNQFTTGGTVAHGIFALANDSNSGAEGEITTVSFQANTLQATGSNATGLYTLASQGGQLGAATFVGNLIQQATNSGVLVQTSGMPTAGLPSGLCVASFTGNTSLTGVTDLTIIQSAGNLRFLDFSVANVQAANTGFGAIGFSNVGGVPTFDTAATPSCP
ncbi:MAG: hypothetical protein AAGG51_03865 [Cyanobacteria bacterium P01_G01_bin.54]